MGTGPHPDPQSEADPGAQLAARVALYRHHIEDGQHDTPASEYDAVELHSLASDLVKVVQDFLPNVGRCVLQDYARLNDSLVRARQLGLSTAK